MNLAGSSDDHDMDLDSIKQAASQSVKAVYDIYVSANPLLRSTQHCPTELSDMMHWCRGEGYQLSNGAKLYLSLAVYIVTNRHGSKLTAI